MRKRGEIKDMGVGAMSAGVEFRQYRGQMARAAKELCYGQEVINRVKAANTVREIDRIMQSARYGKIDSELKQNNAVKETSEERKAMDEIYKEDEGDKYYNKLTKEDAIYIREHFVSRDKEFGVSALARKFNVTKMCIYGVIWGRTWSEV
jgi:hypothetical protein